MILYSRKSITTLPPLGSPNERDLWKWLQTYEDKTGGRNMHFWVLPQEVSVADSSTTFNDDGTVTDPAIEHRLLNIGRQVVKFTSLQRTVKNTDFMKLWEGLPTW